jgi:arylsulfatase A-like enzyme
MLKPIDGSSLKPLFTADLKERAKPLPFRHQGRAALVDNRYKLVAPNLAAGPFELYDLESDPKESRDLTSEEPEVSKRLKQALLTWNESVQASVAGRDYPERKVHASEPPTRAWMNAPEYQKFLPQWRDRPEYNAAITKSSGKAKKKR